MRFTVVSSPEAQCVNVYPDIIIDDSDELALDQMDQVYQSLWDDIEKEEIEKDPDMIFDIFVERLKENEVNFIVDSPQREIINLPA